MTDHDPSVAVAPLRRDLGGGLLLRRAAPADAEALAEFNATVHGDPETGQTDPAIAVWVRDLLERPHPTFRPDLFTVVEESATGKIVSSLNLIPQTWSYEGIAFGVGRVELVGTVPEYRRRGLVKTQMDVAHGWSAALGHLAQGITGIPWYYRQFGYEMTLTLDGNHRVETHAVPALPDGEPEPFRVRPATPGDLPFVAAVDERARGRYLVTCERDAAMWRYELDGRSAVPEGHRVVLHLIEAAGDGDGAGRPVGYVAPLSGLYGTTLAVTAFELAAGESWLAVAPSVLRALKAIGEGYGAAGTILHAESKPGPCHRLMFDWAVEHPLQTAFPRLVRFGDAPYAWYLRVSDLPAFLLRIAPTLEARLAASVAAGHTGSLTLGFYRGGVELTFAGGRLTDVSRWHGEWFAADARFPDLTFLHLLFGHRSLEEVRFVFPDAGARTDAAKALLPALFPKRPSLVWPVG